MNDFDDTRAALVKPKRRRYKEKNKLAIKTLETVYQQWFDNVPIIKYKIVIPAKIDAAHNLVPVLVACCVVMTVWGSNKILSLLLGIAAYLYFKHEIKYDQVVKIRINRYTGQGVVKNKKNGEERKMKYKAYCQLDAFRLPEDDDGTYRDMREKLQSAISSETGWKFI
ncbi:MAG: hypothetical protein IJ566_05785 [Cardiobacteriaceae bacterium]|nr:hypothetical protein [Cardiobacteriaceae bacterium]